MPGRVDVLLVSIGSTGGWRSAAEGLASALQRAGAGVEVAQARPWPTVRTFALTDFVQARAARQAALAGIERAAPRAIVYCSITAALLWPVPGAIFLDSIAAENRPGRHGIWQRPVERRRLRRAPLVMAWSDRSLQGLTGPHPATVVVPPAIDDELVPLPGHARDLAAVTYAGDPVKRRLEMVLEAWAAARRPDETLVVTGARGPARPGVEFRGMVSGDEFRSLLGRARLFLAAPQREDHGIAALEAMAAGCRLVTTPAAGAYPALELARRLDPRLVGEDLSGAIRIGLDDARPGYAEEAAQMLQPFRRRHVDRIVADAVLPRLLGQRP